MKNRIKQAGLLLALALSTVACRQGSSTEMLDGPSKGDISIAVDESLKPLLDAEIDVFESQNPEASINVVYTSESDAINRLLMDSARLAIVTRRLTAEEEQVLRNQQYKSTTTVIAYDGIAFILNKENTDSIYSTEILRQILSGEITDWKGVNKEGRSGNIQVVFDNHKSGAIRYLTDSLLQGKSLGKHCFAVKSNPDVIEYVKNNKDAIGVIGACWISDSDDTLSQSFLKTIRVANIIPHDPETAEAPSMKPYQAYLALKQYPFRRTITVISREPRVGLGTGFTRFLAGDRGQRIVQKSGIVPATFPVRLIHVK